MTDHTDPFTKAILLQACFRGDSFNGSLAFLLMIALRRGSFCGSDLPGELSQGSKHIAGAACGALLKMEMVEVIGRIASPHKNANRRKVNVYALKAGRKNAAVALLKQWGYEDAEAGEQLQLLA